MKPIVVAIILLVTPLAHAQELTIGKELSASLEPDSKHTYTFESGADYYVYGYVDQISVDVVVRVLDAEGTQLAEFDSPARGPEPFQFTPDDDGSYTVEVTPFEGAEGDYRVLLVANEPKATDPEALVDQMMTPFTGRDRPGASISVVKNGEIVLSKGYGMANLTYGIPMTENTGMSIASVSKHFTAMAILLLEQDGKLSLEDDVRKHIPELKDFGTPVTLRNMLNHTTGYREILNFLPMSGWQFTDAMNVDDPIRVIQQQTNLQNEPGAEYNYNNTSFMLLARVVERVSGQTWKDYMEERIFRPLGMDNTTVKTQQGQVISGSSQGYASAEGGGFRYVTDFASTHGASGVNTTALDITKWMANFRDGTVGGKEVIESLTTRGILTTGDTTNYALGLGVRTWRGQKLYTHTGGETSHRTYFGYFPDIDSGIFFSGNNPSFTLGMWTDFAEAFFGEYLDPEEEDEEGEHSMPTAEQLEAISGTWKFVAGPLKIDYTVEDGNLFAQTTNQPKFAVNPTSDSTFTFVGVAASVTFHFESDGTTTRATHHQGPDSAMEKIEATDLTEDQLKEFTGRFYNEELQTIYSVKFEEGKLMAHHRRYEPFGFTHSVDDEFAGGMWFLGNIKYDRDPTGAISGFMASNGRTRDVWFEKMK